MELGVSSTMLTNCPCLLPGIVSAVNYLSFINN
jgi:hypothetical protein